MFQMLKNVSARNVENSFFTTSINTHILLHLKLSSLKAHHTTVTLIHGKEILSKKTTFRATCSLEYLNGAITLISIALR